MRRVVGADDPTQDIAAVQEAVNSSHKVRLVGTFDFGESGQVVLNEDIDISGQPGATIKRGLLSFSSPLPATLPPETPGPAISIRHLTFDGARQAPIDIAYARSVEISHNRIRNVRPISYSIPPDIAAKNPLASNVTSIQEGVVLGSFSSIYTHPIKALTGTVSIRNNDIDMSVSADPGGNLCEGVVMMRGWGVIATIGHNRISGCTRNAMEAIDNSSDETGAGSVDISNNEVEMPAEGVAYPTPSRPNGIIVGWFNDTSRAMFDENVPYRVTNNVVTGGGPFSLGIFANTTGVAIRENRVTVRGVSTNGTYGIMVTSPDGDVSNNEVDGSGRIAFALYKFFPTISPDGNTLRCNDASRFDASVSDLFIFQGTGNKVVGLGGYDSIIDLGTGNTLVDVGCEGEARD